MRFALAPTVRELDPAARAAIHEQVRRRWAKFVMLAATLLLISGIMNLGLAARYTYEPVFGMKGAYHMIVGIKFLLALPIFLFASFLAGRSQTAKKFQENALFWMNVNLALALTMVLIGGTLRFDKRDLKTDQPAAMIAGPAANATNALPFLVAGE